MSTQDAPKQAPTSGRSQEALDALAKKCEGLFKLFFVGALQFAAGFQQALLSELDLLFFFFAIATKIEHHYPKDPLTDKIARKISHSLDQYSASATTTSILSSSTASSSAASSSDATPAATTTKAIEHALSEKAFHTSPRASKKP